MKWLWSPSNTTAQFVCWYWGKPQKAWVIIAAIRTKFRRIALQIPVYSVASASTSTLLLLRWWWWWLLLFFPVATLCSIPQCNVLLASWLGPSTVHRSVMHQNQNRCKETPHVMRLCPSVMVTVARSLRPSHICLRARLVTAIPRFCADPDAAQTALINWFPIRKFSCNFTSDISANSSSPHWDRLFLMDFFEFRFRPVSNIYFGILSTLSTVDLVSAVMNEDSFNM
jgi:hypothetical protein